MFGIVAFAIFLFYPEKLKAIAYTIGWTLLFLALPLILISTNQLLFLYRSWFDLLSYDHSVSYGLSTAGWLYSWFGVAINKNIILLLGAIIFLIPALKFKYYEDQTFKTLFLSSILIWVVIFNHKAESATFIIAVAGVAIWFYSQERKIENTILLFLAIIFTVLSPTDLFPKGIRENYVIPYVLKAVPCILIWFKIIYELTTFGMRKSRDLIT